MKLNKKRLRLLPIAATIAAMVVPATTFAQASDGSSIELEEVVVTGTRLRNQLSVDAKRNNDGIGDYLVADEIGRQPDFNIADAFRRAPGITTVFDEDEGRAVGIRGLSPSFTVTKVDGVTIATSEVNSRQTNLEVIPSSSVGRLNIFKSRNARSEGNAIGGTIELGLISAFDRPTNSFTGSASLGYTDNQDVPGVGFGRGSDNGESYRFDGTFSTKFLDDKIGLTIAGSYLERRRDQQRDIPLNEFNDNGIVVPGRFLFFNYPNTIERFGGTAKLEFRPNDNFDASIILSSFEQQDTELRYGEFIDIRDANIVNTGGNNFSFDGAAANAIFNAFFIDKPTTTAAVKFNWRPSDKQSVRFRASTSDAENFEPNNSVGFAGGFTNSLAGTLNADVGGNIPSVTVPNTSAIVDGSTRSFTGSGISTRSSEDFVDEIGLDYSFNTETGSTGYGFDVGVQSRTNDRDLSFTSTSAALAAGAPGLTLDQFTLTTFANTFQNQPQPFIDYQGFLDFQQANPSLFAFTQNDGVGNYNFEEEVTALYGQVVYRGERLYVDAGLRFEDTETTVNRQIDGVFAVDTSEYDDVLPSVNISYDLNENMKLRGSYYAAVGRPDPIDLVGGGSTGTSAGGIATISTGNVDLEARTADNFDVSFEYYFPEGKGLFSAAAFYKSISDDIFRFTDQETINGVLTEVNTPRNASDSDLKGVELSFVWNNFDFLPAPFDGLGVNTNLTLIDGEIDVVGPGGSVLRSTNLLQQPETIFNVALFYSKGGLETRFVYNRTGDVQDSISGNADGTADRINRSQFRLDWSGSYNINDNLQFTAEVRNLTNETSGIFVTGPGGVGSILRDQSLFGRTFFAGVAFNY